MSAHLGDLSGFGRDFPFNPGRSGLTAPRPSDLGRGSGSGTSLIGLGGRFLRRLDGHLDHGVGILEDLTPVDGLIQATVSFLKKKREKIEVKIQEMK